MGFETHHHAQIDHPELGLLTWYVAEYPAGAFNDKETTTGPHRLVQDFDYGIGGPPDYQSEAEEMVEWFFTQYEDPANETPYAGKEGGYQYIAGGPYDAREELMNYYPEASERAIEIAVDEIQKGGTLDWAPVRGTEGPEIYDTDDLADTLEAAIDFLPDQSPGARFVVTDAGRIGTADIRPATADDLSEISALKTDAIKSAAELVTELSGTNAHTTLFDTAQRYLAALKDEPLSIDQLYAAGIRLENASAHLISADLPPLPQTATTALASVLDLHGVIIASTERGRLLMARAQTYARTASETADLKQKTQALTAAIVSAEGVADADAGSLLAELSCEIGAGPHPERSTEQAVTASGNFLLTMVKACGTGLFSGLVVTGVLGSDSALAATNEITTLTNLCTQFFTTNFDVIRAFAAAAGADLNWLDSICKLLNYAKARLKPKVKG